MLGPGRCNPSASTMPSPNDCMGLNGCVLNGPAVILSSQQRWRQSKIYQLAQTWLNDVPLQWWVGSSLDAELTGQQLHCPVRSNVDHDLDQDGEGLNPCRKIMNMPTLAALLPAPLAALGVEWQDSAWWSTLTVKAAMARDNKDENEAKHKDENEQNTNCENTETGNLAHDRVGFHPRRKVVNCRAVLDHPQRAPIRRLKTEHVLCAGVRHRARHRGQELTRFHELANQIPLAMFSSQVGGERLAATWAGWERSRVRWMTHRMPRRIEYHVNMHQGVWPTWIPWCTAHVTVASSKAWACSKSASNHSSIVCVVARSSRVHPLVCIITIMLQT